MKDIQLLVCVVIAVIVGYVIWKIYWKLQIYFNPHITNFFTPTDIFPIANDKKDKYGYYEKIGYDEMKEKTVVICTLLRNAENRIPDIIKQVEYLGKFFQDYKVLVVENDSKDATRKLLLNWVKYNPKVEILGCGINVEKCTLKKAAYLTEGHSVNKQRIDKMAYLRGIYLEKIKEDYHNYDYCFMWDLDLIGSLYIDGVANSMGWLSSFPHINVMGSMGMYRWMGLLLFYDTYAYVKENECTHINYKWWNDLKKGLGTPLMHKRGSDPVKVESIFSGFCIYKVDALVGLEVDYTTKNECDIECEHHILNKKIGGVYLNPSMIYLILRND
ncbi:MAG TPA: hypothetical protein VLE02_01390 [Nitrosarchaeum sp.]|nr:hypothetical protein [Nitrosarchaeum sp.]